MQEQIRKELTQICLDIINDTQSLALEDQLESARALYEKLLVQNYLAKQTKQHKPQSLSISEVSTPAEPETTKEVIVEEQEIKVAEETHIEEEPEIKEEPVLTDNPSKLEVVAKTVDETPEPEAEEAKEPETVPMPEISPQLEFESQSAETSADKKTSINERYGTGTIKLGLNDRIAFQKNLFEGSQQDLNRVLSQINTFETYSEAHNFIETMVKGDYDWSEQEETEARFMDLVRGKFGE